MNKLRWGILGAARIARKNWKAIYHSGNGIVTAVASREPARAEQFVRDCQSAFAFEAGPDVFASYEALLAAPQVDAVYIPLPTAIRKEWVIRAAQAGKHVLCEKPCAADAASLREMLAVCRRHNVQFMDGVMFMHSRRLPCLRAVLDDHETFGEIRRVNANFSFLAAGGFMETNIRTNAALEPLGCLGDLGWYCVRFALWAMNWQMPGQVTGRVLNHHAGVPTEFSGELDFAGGVSASFYCSFLANQEQLASVVGTKACVELADFVLPFTSQPVGFDLRHNESTTVGTEWNIASRVERITTGEHGGDATCAQETLMFRNFADAVRGGKLNTEWPDWAWRTQLVVDGCLRAAQAGGAVQVDKL